MRKQPLNIRHWIFGVSHTRERLLSNVMVHGYRSSTCEHEENSV